ncbi:MAG: ABC transporter permease [Bacteroidetes bacterium]|nr:ABC transporter permease [Bacteroidota bacterium]
MRTLPFILQKEFLQIFRNRSLLPIIFVLPIVQLVILSNAATFEVKNVRMSVVDEDQTEASRGLVRKMQATGYFSVVANSPTADQGADLLLSTAASMVIHFPLHFERDLRRSGTARVQMIFDAQDGAKAGVSQAYASSVVVDYSRELGANIVLDGIPAGIDVIPVNWFNAEQRYTTFMVPGILVLLVTIVGMFISAMNIVREKEIGTIEQLNVTPITKSQFVIGKLMPLWVIGLFELAFGLIVAKLLFDVPMVGSIPLVFAMAAVYLVAMLGFGLWLSTMTDTQQQAMFLAWFFMVIFILMSGLFTPIESMPHWAQNIAELNPLAHFIRIMRRVLLMGADFSAIRTEFYWLVGFAMTILPMAVRQYRKVSH